MSPANPARSRFLFAAATLLLVALIAAVYLGSLPAPFELDDHESIVSNASIRDLATFRWLKPPATGGETVSGRPILNLSLAINYAFSGLDVRAYRATNIAIHAANALLLLALLRRTVRRVAGVDTSDLVRAADEITWRDELILAAVALWALHPLQTIAVTYVIQRAESLATFFYLASLYSFARAVSCAPSSRRLWFSASIVSCFLGAGTKETVATAPLLIILFDRTFVAGSFAAAWKARWRVHGALFLSWLLLGGLILANRGRGGAVGGATGIDVWSYFLTQCDAIVRYLRLLLWPTLLIFDYGTETVHGLGQVWLSFVTTLALAGGAVWLCIRNRPTGFAAAAFFIVLAPTSSVVPMAMQTVAEHRMYLPSAAAIVVLGVGVWTVAGRKLRLTPAYLLSAAVVLIGLQAHATYRRNAVYQSELSLWSDTVAKRPNNARAHHNLGLALQNAGQLDQAAGEFRRATELMPNHAFAHASLGALLLRKGQTDEALTHLQKAVELDPQAVDAKTNLAAILLSRGRAPEAAALVRDVIEARPDIPEAHYHFGMALEKSGQDPTAAEREFREAVRLKPDFAAAHLALGNCEVRGRNLAAAERSYREALRHDSRLVDAHFALGNLLAKQQQFASAQQEYTTALELDPGHVQALNNLANCQLVTGQARAAIASYERVLQARPNDEAVKRNLQLAREQLPGGR